MKLTPLIVVCTLGTVVVSASQNPFEVTQNFKQIEKEQEILLSALEKEAKAHKKRDPLIKKRVPELPGEVEVEATPVQSPKSKSAPSVIKEVSVASEPQNVQPKRTVATPVKQSTAPVAKAPAPKAEQKPEIVAIKKIKKEQKTLKPTPKTQKNTLPKVAHKPQPKPQKSSAKKEVAHQTKANKVTSLKHPPKPKAETSVAIEVAKHEVDVMPQEAKKRQPTVLKKPKSQPAVADINITQEQQEAAKRAQEELQKAIREVDAED